MTLFPRNSAFNPELTQEEAEFRETGLPREAKAKVASESIWKTSHSQIPVRVLEDIVHRLRTAAGDNALLLEAPEEMSDLADTLESYLPG